MRNRGFWAWALMDFSMPWECFLAPWHAHQSYIATIGNVLCSTAGYSLLIRGRSVWESLQSTFSSTNSITKYGTPFSTSGLETFSMYNSATYLSTIVCKILILKNMTLSHFAVVWDEEATTELSQIDVDPLFMSLQLILTGNGQDSMPCLTDPSSSWSLPECS